MSRLIGTGFQFQSRPLERYVGYTVRGNIQILECSSWAFRLDETRVASNSTRSNRCFLVVRQVCRHTVLLLRVRMMSWELIRRGCDTPDKSLMAVPDASCTFFVHPLHLQLHSGWSFPCSSCSWPPQRFCWTVVAPWFCLRRQSSVLAVLVQLHADWGMDSDSCLAAALD